MMPLLFWYLRITARSEITAIKKEDNIVVKEYVNGAGYRIKASEKAYNLLYKKNGFLPVEAIGTNMGESPADDTSPMSGEEVSRESTGGKPVGKPRKPLQSRMPQSRLGMRKYPRILKKQVVTELVRTLLARLGMGRHP